MTTPFTILVPFQISDSSFVSSTLSEADHPVYSNMSTYSIGDRVILTTGYHKIYESLANMNMNFFPPTNPDKWVEVGPTNRWAAFDLSGGTFTTGTDSFEFVIQGSNFKSIAFIELRAVNVRVRASSVADGVYYDESVSAADLAVITNWWEYLTTGFKSSNDIILQGIPQVPNSTYTITVEGSGAISLGTFLIGQDTPFGFTQYNAKAGIIDYSRKEVDQFGRVQLVKRAFSKRMDVSIFTDKTMTDQFYRFLADIRATPVLWIGAKDSYEMLTIFGFYRDFTIDIAYPSASLCTLQIEGIA
jgi:hypothetical protein